MGCRLHVAKKYDVQYASIDYFNYLIEEFHYILDALEIDYTGDVYEHDFEVSKEQWRTGMGKLATLNAQELEAKREIEESLKRVELTPERMLEIMEEYLNAADPNNNYLNFSFF